MERPSTAPVDIGAQGPTTYDRVDQLSGLRDIGSDSSIFFRIPVGLSHLLFLTNDQRLDLRLFYNKPVKSSLEQG